MNENVRRLPEDIEEYVKAKMKEITPENIRDKVRARMFDCDDKARIEARVRTEAPVKEVDGGYVVFPTVEIESPDGDGVFSATVSKNMIGDSFESYDELFHVAIANMGEPKLTAMGKPFGETTDLFEDPEAIPTPMNVLTTSNEINGAVIIAAEGMAKKIWDRIGSNYWIIPSSVHEVLIVPDDEKITAEDLNKMLEQGNKTTCIPEEVLSWNVRYYNGETMKVM